MPSEKNSRDTSSKLPVATTATVSPWSRASSPMAESDSSSSLDQRDTEQREKERERENQSEAALLVLISRCFHALLLRREKSKFRDWQMKSDPEDLVPRELQESENSLAFQKPKERKLVKSPPSSRRMWSEEPSRAKRILRLPSDKRLLKSRDLSLMSDLEERESRRRRRLGDGREHLRLKMPTRKFMTNGLQKRKLLPSKPRLWGKLPKPKVLRRLKPSLLQPPSKLQEKSRRKKWLNQPQPLKQTRNECR